MGLPLNRLRGRDFLHFFIKVLQGLNLAHLYFPYAFGGTLFRVRERGRLQFHLDLFLCKHTELLKGLINHPCQLFDLFLIFVEEFLFVIDQAILLFNLELLLLQISFLLLDVLAKVFLLGLQFLDLLQHFLVIPSLKTVFPQSLGVLVQVTQPAHLQSQFFLQGFQVFLESFQFGLLEVEGFTQLPFGFALSLADLFELHLQGGNLGIGLG